MSATSEEPSFLLLLWTSAETAHVCRVRQAEVHDEDWRLCHQTSRQLYNWTAGLLDKGFIVKLEFQGGLTCPIILADCAEVS